MLKICGRPALPPPNSRIFRTKAISRTHIATQTTTKNQEWRIHLVRTLRRPKPAPGQLLAPACDRVRRLGRAYNAQPVDDKMDPDLHQVVCQHSRCISAINVTVVRHHQQCGSRTHTSRQVWIRPCHRGRAHRRACTSHGRRPGSRLAVQSYHTERHHARLWAVQCRTRRARVVCRRDHRSLLAVVDHRPHCL